MSSEPLPAIVLDESCVSEKDLSCSLVGKIKDINALSNLYVILANEGFDNVSLTYLGGYWVLINIESISSKEKLSKHVGMASWFVELIPSSNSFELNAWTPEFIDEGSDTSSSDEEDIDEDPFEIYKLLNKKKDKEVSKKQVSKDEGPTFPPGFTPNAVDDIVDRKVSGSNKQPNSDSHTSKDGFLGMNKGSIPSLNFKTGGSILQVMEDLVEEGEIIILDDFNEVRAEHEGFGYSYTWAHKSASKMSKLDRFLISEGLISVFPSLSALCLDKHLSDHRPILMRELVVDYRPSPFCVFHSWFSKDGFDKLVERSWKKLACEDSNNILLTKKKLQALKALIKDWCKEDNQHSKAARSAIQSRISEIDKFFYKGKGNEGLVIERTSLLKDLQDINARYSLDLAQKAKNRRSIEGDENSKYFHGIINKKRSQLAIRGVLVDGDWIEEPYKKEILKSNVTYEEIKKAVWDCGTDKSPGPDGFTFDFIRRYWKIMDQDVVNAVHEFFNSSKFPPGCNSYFITLIPKKPDAKMGFLDDILNKFGFGAKWRGWIQGCLNYSMGSILVNGNPTSKFKFHKGLKQGDPLSWFLFILVMESLHLSLNNILNYGLFKGICIDDSLSLSHLFFADDAIFIGKWEKSNFSTIVHMLKCFFLASGLKINIQKSKLMAKLSDSFLIDSFRRPPRGGVEQEQLLGLIDNVYFVILSNSNDRWVWSLESSGEFSVKTTRSHIDDFFLPSVGDPTRWIKIVPIKINIFAWKVRFDRLPTRINLSLCGIDSPYIICPIFCCTGETCSHLFFTCNVARQILCKVARWWELDIPKFHSYEDWLTSLRLSKRLKEVLEAFGVDVVKEIKENNKCVNAADEELTAAKHKLMLFVYCC
uniref:RNA-directed DNA polymerase, eukaryota n=1 Tax=Tanacetum cinerariifolium TaxID=118510 RepID=A0A699I7W6_TANCI|nr:RNA-directed DNA polymerase, eukaryota [Tanacetum cinerariifolium]